MNLFADESLGAIPREVFAFPKSTSTQAPWEVLWRVCTFFRSPAPVGIFRGCFYAKFHAIRQANFPVNCYIRFCANFTTNFYGMLEGAPRGNLSKKKIHRIRRCSFPRDFSRIILCNDRPCVPCDVLHNVPRNFPRDVRRAAP